MDTSSFSNVQQTYPDAEQLAVNSSTSDCFCVRLYGKRHFLKRLKPELSTDPRYVSTLQKEFETGYGLEHPNLVRYIAKGDDYLLTEFVDGETLKDFSLSHPDYFKSRGNTERLLAQLLDVVSYLHTHQVVHLDLKPDNILITRIGHDVKLTDLGYCYTDTYTDTMGRTDKYAAPEQLEGGAVDARTDIYAIGKILESLPCGSKYNKVIGRCTQSDPDARYQTVDEIKAQIVRKPALLYALLALLVVVAALSLFYLLQPNQKLESSPQPQADSIVIEQTEAAEQEQPVEHRESAPPIDTRSQQKAELKAELPALVDPIYNSTIATYDFKKYGGDLDVWMPLHKEYVERINNLPKRLEKKYPSLDEITISNIIWSYAQPSLEGQINRVTAIREHADSILSER